MTMSITKGHTRLIPCSLHSDCKNVQKSALKSVNVQRTGKSILQMFAFSFFEGSHICRFLPILRPSTVPRSHFSYPKTKAFTLIISHLYLQIVTSASESEQLKQLRTIWNKYKKVSHSNLLCLRVTKAIPQVEQITTLPLLHVVALLPFDF